MRMPRSTLLLLVLLSAAAGLLLVLVLASTDTVRLYRWPTPSSRGAE